MEGGNADARFDFNDFEVAGWRMEEGGFFEEFEGFVWSGCEDSLIGGANLAKGGIGSGGDVAGGEEAGGEFFWPAAEERLSFGDFKGEMFAFGKVEGFSAGGENDGVEIVEIIEGLDGLFF